MEATGRDISNIPMGTAVTAGCGGMSGGGCVGRRCSRSSRGGVEVGRSLDSTASWPRHSAAAAVRAASEASSILVEGPWHHLEGVARGPWRRAVQGGVEGVTVIHRWFSLDHLKARECGFFHLGSITSTPGHYRNTASNCFDHELTIYRIAFFYRFYALQTYSENATYLR